MDGNIYFQFQGQASLFSEGRTPEQNALILGGDERTLHIIMTIVVLEGDAHTIFRMLNFIFGDAAPDTDL